LAACRAGRRWHGVAWHLDHLLAAEPGQVPYHLEAAQARTELGRHEQVVADCTRAIDLGAAEARAWYYRGVARLGQGQLELALADLSAALERDPADADTWFQRARVRAARKEQERAVEDYTRAIERKPFRHLAEAWLERGQAHEKLGRHDQAIADYKEAQTDAATQKLEDALKARGDLVRCFEAAPVHLNCLAFSRDGRSVLGGGYHQLDGNVGMVVLWDVATGKVVAPFKGEQANVHGVAFDPDGGRVLSASTSEGSVLRRDLKTGQVVQRRRIPPTFPVMAFSADGRRALFAAGRFAMLVDLENSKVLRVLEGHTRPVSCVVFSGDGRRALSGADDGTVRLWDLESGKELRRLEGPPTRILSVAFPPDGKQALCTSGSPARDKQGGATDSSDCVIRLWDTDTGRELHRLRGHTQEVTAAVFTPDGRRILSGSWDRTLRLWDAQTGKEIRSWPAVTPVQQVALSPDGRHAAVCAAFDTLVRLWKLPPQEKE
jgi:WD40 repeat protein